MAQPTEPPGGNAGPPPAVGRRAWRRPAAITLVLLGGVTAVGLTTCESRDARCERLLAERHPDAATACADSTRTSSGSSSGASGSAGTGAGDAAGPVSARGGFGSTAHGFSGGG